MENESLFLIIFKHWLVCITDFCELGIQLVSLKRHEYVFRTVQILAMIFGLILFILGPVIGTLTFIYDSISVIIEACKDIKRMKNDIK